MIYIQVTDTSTPSGRDEISIDL